MIVRRSAPLGARLRILQTPPERHCGQRQCVPREASYSHGVGCEASAFPAARSAPSVVLLMHLDQGAPMHDEWRKTRLPRVAAAIGALALVPSAFGGQPVTQTLTPPAPSFYTCMAVASRERLCSRDDQRLVGPEETGLVCGSGGSTFNAFDTNSFIERAARTTIGGRQSDQPRPPRRHHRAAQQSTYRRDRPLQAAPDTHHGSGRPGRLQHRHNHAHWRAHLHDSAPGRESLSRRAESSRAPMACEFRAGPQDFVDYYENGDTCGRRGTVPRPGAPRETQAWWLTRRRTDPRSAVEPEPSLGA